MLVGDFIWPIRAGQAALSISSRRSRKRTPTRSEKSKPDGIARNETAASDIDLRCLMAAAGASAQVPLTPPAAPTPASRPRRKRRPRNAKERQSRRLYQEACGHAQTGRDANSDSESSPQASFDDPNVDLVYGAYQRGLYKTALDLALTRAQYAATPRR